MIDSCELVGANEYVITWKVPLQKEAKTNFSCVIGSAEQEMVEPGVCTVGLMADPMKMRVHTYDIAGKPAKRPSIWRAFATSASLPLRPRMGGAIDGAEARGVDVGVALGGRQAGVAQQLLDGAQIAAGAQQVGGEGMAQRMRRHAFGAGRAGGAGRAPASARSPGRAAPPRAPRKKASRGPSACINGQASR